MTFTEFYQKYLEFIWNAFMYDADVFSKWWIYAPLLIPFVFYLMFFMMKWSFLTAPIWMPITIVFGLVSEIFGRPRNSVTKTKEEK